MTALAGWLGGRGWGRRQLPLRSPRQHGLGEHFLSSECDSQAGEMPKPTTFDKWIPMDENHNRSYRWLRSALLILFLIVAAVRIVLTYSVFNQTWDEAVHVACGMEWLQQGTYNYEDLHPPLARVAVAIGPYLSGIRIKVQDPNPDALATGNAIFAARGQYLHNLTLSRLGVLPFFLLAAWVVWYWTRRLFGNWAAVAAVGLFTTVPPILGHAGVATTDLPLAATFVLALFAFTIWLERPTTAHSLFLGVSVGLAIMSKFSALLFLAACGTVILLCWSFGGNTTIRERRVEMSPRLRRLGLAVLVCAVVVSACYRFSFRPAAGAANRPHQFVDHLFEHQAKLRSLSYEVVEKTPVPVPEFFIGMKQAGARTSGTTNMYLLGQVRNRGWWYFFPVALLVKTPIAFLILTIIGAFAVIMKWKNAGHDWRILVPLVSALALMLVSLPTKFNIGLRHILPIYPLLAILAGFGLIQLWQVKRPLWLARILAIGLATWMLASSAMAQPDNLAYFNEFAGKHPEGILVDSDLDWGQDLLRLSNDLHARGVDHVAIAYNGSADLKQMNLPSFDVLAPCTRTTGWIAISLYDLEMSQPSVGCGGFSWLEAYKPVAPVGKSIWLYSIPDTGSPSPVLLRASKDSQRDTAKH
jgi:4-amino-4-deoxy-L-arabinose transferase-like glycosyltransferase